MQYEELGLRKRCPRLDSGPINLKKGSIMLKKLMICLSLLVAIPLAAYAQNIDGVWHDARGVPYYIRQVGNEIWWFGENQPLAPVFSNVAHGKIDIGRVL